jgi:hypothetical protein
MSDQDDETADDLAQALLLAKAADLRSACIHEFAHEAVARHFGAWGRVTIRPNTGADWWQNKLYAGTFDLARGILNEHQQCLVGLAGAIAEHIDRYPDISCDDIVGSFNDDKILLSETDRQFTARYSSDDVRKCFTLVKSLWAEIERNADFEIRCIEKEGNAGPAESG